MNLVRLAGFSNEHVSLSLVKKIKSSLPLFSMGSDDVSVFVRKRVFNGIWVGFRRGQSSVRVNVLMDSTTRASDQSGAEALSRDACCEVENIVRPLGFKVYHVLDLLRDKKGCVVRSSDGRVIKDLVHQGREHAACLLEQCKPSSWSLGGDKPRSSSGPEETSGVEEEAELGGYSRCAQCVHRLYL